MGNDFNTIGQPLHNWATPIADTLHPSYNYLGVGWLTNAPRFVLHKCPFPYRKLHVKSIVHTIVLI